MIIAFHITGTLHGFLNFGRRHWWIAAQDHFHNQLSKSKSGAYSIKPIGLHEIFYNEKYLPLEKINQWLSLLINIKLCYRKQANGVVVLWVALPLFKKLVNRKMLYQWMGLLTNVWICYKETGSKVGCFAGFFSHHHSVTLSVHTHIYHYALFESGMITGFWTTALCRKDIALYIM